MVVKPQPLIGELAVRSLGVDGGLTVAELGRIFRTDPTIGSVVARDEAGGGIGLVTRATFDREMYGRLGFGEALLSGRPVSALADWDPVVVAAEDTLETATALVLKRPIDKRHADLVVQGRDGSTGAVSTARLFESMAGLYEHHAMHDALTGLPNRLMLIKRLQHALTDPRGTRRLAWCSSTWTTSAHQRHLRSRLR